MPILLAVASGDILEVFVFFLCLNACDIKNAERMPYNFLSLSLEYSAVKRLIASKIKFYIYIIYTFVLCIFIMYIFKANMLCFSLSLSLSLSLYIYIYIYII